MSSAHFEHALKAATEDAWDPSQRGTYELGVALRMIDLRRDRRFNGCVNVPHRVRSFMKIGAIVGRERAAAMRERTLDGVTVIDVPCLRALNKNKKAVKKFCAQYDVLFAAPSIIRQIPRLIGPSVGKAGKFPTVLEDDFEHSFERARRRVKWQMKKVLCLNVAIGSCDLTPDMLYENASTALAHLQTLLPKSLSNVKHILLKKTHGSAVIIRSTSHGWERKKKSGKQALPLEYGTRSSAVISARSRTTCCADLPREVWFEIFACCAGVTLLRLRKTCVMLRTLLSHDRVWEVAFRREFPNLCRRRRGKQKPPQSGHYYGRYCDVLRCLPAQERYRPEVHPPRETGTMQRRSTTRKCFKGCVGRHDGLQHCEECVLALERQDLSVGAAESALEWSNECVQMCCSEINGLDNVCDVALEAMVLLDVSRAPHMNANAVVFERAAMCTVEGRTMPAEYRKPQVPNEVVKRDTKTKKKRGKNTKMPSTPANDACPLVEEVEEYGCVRVQYRGLVVGDEGEPLLPLFRRRMEVAVYFRMVDDDTERLEQPVDDDTERLEQPVDDDTERLGQPVEQAEGGMVPVGGIPKAAACAVAVTWDPSKYLGVQWRGLQAGVRMAYEGEADEMRLATTAALRHCRESRASVKLLQISRYVVHVAAGPGYVVLVEARTPTAATALFELVVGVHGIKTKVYVCAEVPCMNEEGFDGTFSQRLTP